MSWPKQWFNTLVRAPIQKKKSPSSRFRPCNKYSIHSYGTGRSTAFVETRLRRLPQHSGSLFTKTCSPRSGVGYPHPPASIYARPMWVSRDAVLTPESLRAEPENRGLLTTDFFWSRVSNIQLCEFFINSVLLAVIKLDRSSFDLLIYSRFHV